MKIYTKTGDGGTTSLYGGRRVKKNHFRVDAYGTIDELNSFLGLVFLKLKERRAKEEVRRIQEDLFLIGSSIAGAPSKSDTLPARVKQMEEYIDKLEGGLPKLKNFIYYRGVESALLFFLGRAMVRRAERKLVALSKKETVEKKMLVYFNRLSDLLFMMGRYLNFKSGIKEEIWK